MERNFFKEVKELGKIKLKQHNYLYESLIENVLTRLAAKEKMFKRTDVSKLTKLKVIMAKRRFDLDNNFMGEHAVKAELTDLEHTMDLVKKLLGITEDHIHYYNETDSIAYYSREVEGFKAELRHYEFLKGFRLVIKNKETVIFDRMAGGPSLLHKRNWVNIKNEVNALELGLWSKDYSSRGDTFKFEYKVDPKHIGHIKEKIRLEYFKAGLMTSVRGGEGFTVGNKGIGNLRYSYDDIISISNMVYGMSAHDFSEAIRIANAVLISEGYTEKYER